MEKYYVRIAFVDGDVLEKTYDYFSDAYTFLYDVIPVYFLDKKFNSVEMRCVHSEKI